MVKRSLVVLGLVLAFVAISFGQATWRSTPADIELINSRLKNAAAKYGTGGPIRYFALSDIGYPYDANEFNQLDGNAVVLITALSQDKEEMPLRRVYVRADGKEFDLKVIKAFTSTLSDTKGDVAIAFGSNREDVLYLMPVYLRMKEAELVIEFHSSKTAVVNTFDGSVPAALVGLPKTPPTGRKPSKKVLDTFLQREYPAFFETKPSK
jgi:hypothetical protein